MYNYDHVRNSYESAFPADIIIIIIIIMRMLLCCLRLLLFIGNARKVCLDGAKFCEMCLVVCRLCNVCLLLQERVLPTPTSATSSLVG